MEEVEIEELFTLECFETREIIFSETLNKKIFTEKEAREVFLDLTEEQQYRFRLVAQEAWERQ